MISNMVTSKKRLNMDNDEMSNSRPNLAYGWITDCYPDERVSIDHRLIAERAVSCVITPQEGDYVLYAECQGKTYLLNILHRNSDSAAEPTFDVELSVKNSKQLLIESEHLRFHGTKSVHISTFGPLSISACMDSIKMTAQNMFSSVTGTLVQVARNSSLAAQEIFIEAKHVLSSRGKHQLITAEEDVRIDGERINMG